MAAEQLPAQQADRCGGEHWQQIADGLKHLHQQTQLTHTTVLLRRPLFQSLPGCGDASGAVKQPQDLDVLGDG